MFPTLLAAASLLVARHFSMNQAPSRHYHPKQPQCCLPLQLAGDPSRNRAQQDLSPSPRLLAQAGKTPRFLLQPLSATCNSQVWIPHSPSRQETTSHRPQHIISKMCSTSAMASPSPQTQVGGINRITSLCAVDHLAWQANLGPSTSAAVWDLRRLLGFPRIIKAPSRC